VLLLLLLPGGAGYATGGPVNDPQHTDEQPLEHCGKHLWFPYTYGSTPQVNILVDMHPPPLLL
jgi:hypothetical protein